MLPIFLKNALSIVYRGGRRAEMALDLIARKSPLCTKATFLDETRYMVPWFDKNCQNQKSLLVEFGNFFTFWIIWSQFAKENSN